MKRKIISCLTGISACFLTACAGVPTAPENFEKIIVETDNLNFVTYAKNTIKPKKTLRFYLEGNGHPNPKKPMALLLAQEDAYSNIVVLTRPCQYIDAEVCSKKSIWGTNRYHPEILKAMKDLVVFYAKKHNSQQIEFVAYSDSAPIAFYLAQNLGATKKIITVAGVLDIDSYAKQNKLPVFKNAYEVALNKSFVARIPQVHYVGSEDEIVTKSMTERFVSNLYQPKDIQVKVVHGIGHDDWDKVKLDY